jgi:Alpha-L-arabinofuranosidase B, catalytic
MTDQENNLVGCVNPDGSKLCANLPNITWRFVTAIAKGEPHHWTSMGGDAQRGGLSVMFDGPRIDVTYDPMRKQGAILLATAATTVTARRARSQNHRRCAAHACARGRCPDLRQRHHPHRRVDPRACQRSASRHRCSHARGAQPIQVKGQAIELQAVVPHQAVGSDPNGPQSTRSALTGSTWLARHAGRTAPSVAVARIVMMANVQMRVS